MKKRKIKPWMYWKVLTKKYCGELLWICTQFRPRIVTTSLNITWICVISISVLLNNSVSMHSIEKVNVILIHLNPTLQLNSIPNYLFQKSTQTKWKMSEGLCSSSKTMSKKRNLFTAFTLLYNHSGSRLNKSFIELGN